MKDIIGKSKIKSTNLPRKLTINRVDVYNKPEIERYSRWFLYKYLSETGQSKTFEIHLKHLKHVSIKWMS